MSDTLERLRDALADRYAVESEIGRGGMATVFLAEDLKHGRKVAVKVLHPQLAATLGPERFLREIEIAAGLNHPHILPLFDSGEAAGLLYYVMPYVEGESLRDRLENEGPLPIEEAVGITADVADGLNYAHRQDVIHRDIKPGNVLLSEGHALIADFGVARAIGAASEGGGTATGLAVGTPRYMAPEQMTGESDIDGRVDVYALGCVLWESLAGEPPFGGPTPQAILVRKAVEDAPDVRTSRSEVPEPLEVCLEVALAREPSERFATAGDFAGALRDAVLLGVSPEAVARRRKRRRRRTLQAMLAIAILAGGIFGWRAYTNQQQVRWARTEAVPEIRRLALVGYFDSALAVAERAVSILPRDTALQIPWDSFSLSESIVTDPPGAQVYRKSFGGHDDTTWHFKGVTPLDSVRLPRFDSRWRFEREGYVTREIASPAGWSLGRFSRLDPPDSIPPGMVRVNGFRLEEGQWGNRVAFSVGDYFLDRFEVTNRDYMKFVRDGGYESAEYWKELLQEAGTDLAWHEAIARFVDRTGRPGPSTWEYGVYPDGHEEHPVGGVSWYEAAAFARFAGKSLPSLWHLDVAMDDELNGVFIPNSNIGPTEGSVAVGTLESMGTFGTYDQYGNVREWVHNLRDAGRLIFGGGWSDVEHQYQDWEVRALSPWDRSPENGIRLAEFPDTTDIGAAYMSPQPEEQDEPLRDYYSETPAGDLEYAAYARSYDYDLADLEPHVEQADTIDGWPMERVSFAGPDSTKRMQAYLFLPTDARPPYQTVLVWTGYGVLLRRFEPDALLLFDFFLKAGLAVALPVLTGTFSPIDQEYRVDTSWLPGIFSQSPEVKIQWVKELRRTLDYIGTRRDIDHDRIAYYGNAIGATDFPIILALEPRIKVGLTDTGALSVWGYPPPEVDPFHFLPRVRTPLMIVNSRYDYGFPHAASQLPTLEYAGTPAEHKRLVSTETSFPVPNWAVMREAIPWFEKYLGSVEGF